MSLFFFRGACVLGSLWIYINKDEVGFINVVISNLNSRISALSDGFSKRAIFNAAFDTVYSYVRSGNCIQP